MFVTNSVMIPRILSFFGYFMHVTFNYFRQVEITFFIFEEYIYRERVSTELFPQMFFAIYNLLIALELSHPESRLLTWCQWLLTAVLPSASGILILLRSILLKMVSLVNPPSVLENKTSNLFSSTHIQVHVVTSS